MADYIESRDDVLDSLKRELVGPDPRGSKVDCSKTITFSSKYDVSGPNIQLVNDEEIIKVESPVQRYGVGVLYPIAKDIDEAELLAELESSGLELQGDDGIAIDSKMQKGLEKISKNKSTEGDDSVEDFDIGAANAMKPSSMAISFLLQLEDDEELAVTVAGGTYRRETIKYEVVAKSNEQSPNSSEEDSKKKNEDTDETSSVSEDQEGTQISDDIPGHREWWLRSSVAASELFTKGDIATEGRSRIKRRVVLGCNDADDSNKIFLDIELYSRPWKDPGQFLLTACVINRTEGSTLDSTKCLFQTELEVSFSNSDGRSKFLQYPDAYEMSGADLTLDPEEESLALLYRNKPTYAVGHGCAANWLQVEEGDARVIKLMGESLPIYDSPSMTPDVTTADGNLIRVSMAELSGANGAEFSLDPLEQVIGAYEDWINGKRREIEDLNPRFSEAATRHIEDCDAALIRMKEGLEYLRSDDLALTAFKLANEAILIQQSRASREVREAKMGTDNRLGFSHAPPQSYPAVGEIKGNWRAFQIAFFLMSLKSTVDGTDADRDRVELIWFPTGGGKTEAYLGLAAFAMFHRRLKDPEDVGTQILMRYTLRLLTAQQFQRACGVICAMEYIRKQRINELKLGEKPFSIGIWVGGKTTPNSIDDAKKAYDDLFQSNKAKNPFVLTKCPWCSARIGPPKTRVAGIKLLGYKKTASGVSLNCSDSECAFYSGLPVQVVDEVIYRDPPTFLIATADKFATLAWKSEARSIFGKDGNGETRVSPPSLIIQDELHLISGPLGSMYGLYESVIEELCIDRRDGGYIKPKIVCSTATIRRYESQVRALYGRGTTCLFPPPGLDDSDSFFARFARNQETGKLLPGRRFVGIFAPSLYSMQTIQVRAMSPLLQSAMDLAEDKRDPWWTLLVFFNSLRELGTTLTLFQSDIPDYFGQVRKRRACEFKDLRAVGRLDIKELTARLESEEVPDAIEALETEYGRKNAVDVCLASNIIEVGVDIDRLSLLCIIGQPKTTAQYIQVSGRVGRRWWERPGLIVTLYGPSKARDRSHFEKFRTYHERLYAQVEPTSVTPFSPPVIDRALHSTMVAFVRQLGDESVSESPSPTPADLLDRFRQLILERVKVVNPAETENVEKVFARRLRQWELWDRGQWQVRGNSEGIGLIRRAGEYVDPNLRDVSWAVSNSIRNVDASCEAEISQSYIQADEDSQELG